MSQAGLGHLESSVNQTKILPLWFIWLNKYEMTSASLVCFIVAVTLCFKYELDVKVLLSILFACPTIPFVHIKWL